MNKESLLNKVYVKSPFNKGKSTSIFNSIFENIKKSIRENHQFEIDSFGEFTVERRDMHTIIDVEKKAEILLPPKDKIVFKPADELINRIKENND